MRRLHTYIFLSIHRKRFLTKLTLTLFRCTYPNRAIDTIADVNVNDKHELERLRALFQITLVI